jgi:hypothetical protein
MNEKGFLIFWEVKFTELQGYREQEKYLAFGNIKKRTAIADLLLLIMSIFTVYIHSLLITFSVVVADAKKNKCFVSKLVHFRTSSIYASWSRA